MAGGQGADSEEYFDSNNPWCACTYYGEDVCDDGGGGTGGLTEEQIAALEALAEALENAQNNANAAATDLASLNSLLESLESVKATFLTAEDNVIQSLADINDSLDLLNGYLEVGQALNDEALDVINQQIATALINRGIAETINRECQGTTIGDPVLLASGVEDYKKTDLSYEVVNSLVKIQRRYRSNRNEEVSSFGKGWFFNYDSKVIAGRKPFIKERQELTQQLSAEAADLAAKAEAALDDVFSALDNANYWMEVVSGKQSEIDGIIAQIAPLVNEINGHASASQAAANEAAAQAAIADIPEAYTDANSAQSAASQAASCAASSAAKEQSADDIQVELAIILQYMEDDMAQAGVKAETSQHREARIGEIESFLLAQASEATEEADREEELFPDNPYPSDPTVYFGAGYLKILDENGSPILYQADDDGLFRPISDDGSYTGHIEQLEGGYKYISKHGEVRLFADNGDGTSRLVRDIDLNGNPTNYHYTNGKVSAIGDVFGRVTRIRYNAQGFINSVTDPQGYTYGYLYENQRLATYIDPAGSKWKYSYDNHGNLSGRTDPHGNTYRYFYDDKNRVIKEVDKEGYAITYTYDPENRVTTMTDRRGEETAYYYNESHRLVRTLYPDNSEVRYGYDDRNNRDILVDENGNTTNISYNQYNDI
ncbi:MAG TPA: DUF6531 domain-containing protein, partial [Desulfopila sp.]|nr:DUF6531 domain-containing protein [Desulfopila sp.]